MSIEHPRTESFCITSAPWSMRIMTAERRPWYAAQWIADAPLKS